MHLFRAVIGTLLISRAALGADLSVIDRYIRTEMELNAVPGAAIAVWHKGEVKYAKASVFEVPLPMKR